MFSTFASLKVIWTCTQSLQVETGKAWNHFTADEIWKAKTNF